VHYRSGYRAKAISKIAMMNHRIIAPKNTRRGAGFLPGAKVKTSGCHTESV